MLPNPTSHQLLCTMSWGEALLEELWFTRGIKSEASQDGDTAVPLSQRCCCLSCLPVPWPQAATRGSTKAWGITQDAEETANEQWKGRNKRSPPSALALPRAAAQAQGRDAALASGGSWRAGEQASTVMARPDRSTGQGSLPTSFPAAASSCDSQPCHTGSPQTRFKLRRKQNSQWELPPPGPS